MEGPLAALWMELHKTLNDACEAEFGPKPVWALSEIEAAFDGKDFSDQSVLKVLRTEKPVDAIPWLENILRTKPFHEGAWAWNGHLAAVVLALLGNGTGVEWLRNPQARTSSQLEIWQAKAALKLLGEPIPPELASKSSLFPDKELLLTRC
jgi:hypothetical protein